MTRSLALLFASAACFVVALISELGVLTTSPVAWAFGGALAYILSLLP